MATSLLLSATVLGIALFCAWAVNHFGRKAGQSEAKLRALVAMFVLGGASLSVFAFLADFDARRTTLFEELLDGSVGLHGGAILERQFEIEHDSVRHKLMVVPRPAPGEDASGPVMIGIALRDPSGQHVIEETRRFETRTEGTGSFVSQRRVWNSSSWTFSPEATGIWDLRLSLATEGIATVHVRVEDPEKRDGVRAAGY
ncbi:MAG: hypothetical protein GY946_01830 [bacterium]|nr:hypothetical protein [bacterium]